MLPLKSLIFIAELFSCPQATLNLIKILLLALDGVIANERLVISTKALLVVVVFLVVELVVKVVVVLEVVEEFVVVVVDVLVVVAVRVVCVVV